MSDFTPYTVVKKPRPVWMTPEFNPDPNQSVFAPYSIVVSNSGLSPQTQAQLLRLGQQMSPVQKEVKPSVQTMESVKGMVQLPNGQFVTQEQYQKLLKMLQKRK